MNRLGDGVPHGGAVKVHHHPLGGVEGERVGEFDAVEPVAELGAQEGRAGVGGVHVQPQLLAAAQLADVAQVVEGAGARRPQRRAHLSISVTKSQ